MVITGGFYNQVHRILFIQFCQRLYYYQSHLFTTIRMVWHTQTQLGKWINYVSANAVSANRSAHYDVHWHSEGGQKGGPNLSSTLFLKPYDESTNFWRIHLREQRILILPLPALLEMEGVEGRYNIEILAKMRKYRSVFFSTLSLSLPLPLSLSLYLWLWVSKVWECAEREYKG